MHRVTRKKLKKAGKHFIRSFVVSILVLVVGIGIPIAVIVYSGQLWGAIGATWAFLVWIIAAISAIGALEEANII